MESEEAESSSVPDGFNNEGILKMCCQEMMSTNEEFETETQELPAEVEVITQTKVIPTEDGDILVTTKTTRHKKVKVTKNVIRRIYEVPVSGSVKGDHQSLQLHNIPQRRGSFLYRKSRKDNATTSQTSSKNSTSNDRNNTNQDNSRTADDVIITPFAQILASLRKVRSNFMMISKGLQTNTEEPQPIQQSMPTNERDNITNKDGKIAFDTLKELEWCLERLESIQTYRSVSDMASTKFKQIINRELNQCSDSSKSSHQVSDYICKTFLESPSNDDEAMDASSNANEFGSFEREQSSSIDDVDGNKAGSQWHDKKSPDDYKPSLSLSRSSFRGANKHNTIHEESSDRNSDVTMTSSDKKNNTNTNTTASHLTNQSSASSSTTANQLLDQFRFGVAVADESGVDNMLQQDLNRWGMDLFEFSELTNNNPLVVLSFSIFQQHNLLNIFQIEEHVLLQFLIRVEAKYRPQVPYHNSIHAADVTQSANVLLGSAALENVFSDIEILSVVLASIVHDMDHPGVTNQYLINTGNLLATLYNDCSVLENHHLASAFSLLAETDCDILSSMNRRQRQSLRRLVIDMVLATDMSKHMNLLADLKTMVETKKVAGSGILTLDNYQDRILILQNLLHCADLSNPTKPLNLYKNWTDRIMQEFFLQGDQERQANLEISPMCDRQTASVEKSQVSFIDFIVHPLWETWTELVYPDSQNILETLESNRQWYLSQL